MFYKVLFVLTIVMFIRDINKYVKECKKYTIVTNESMSGDIPIIVYLKISVSALFYIMVLTLTLRPHLFWW